MMKSWKPQERELRLGEKCGGKIAQKQPHLVTPTLQMSTSIWNLDVWPVNHSV